VIRLWLDLCFFPIPISFLSCWRSCVFPFLPVYWFAGRLVYSSTLISVSSCASVLISVNLSEPLSGIFLCSKSRISAISLYISLRFHVDFLPGCGP